MATLKILNTINSYDNYLMKFGGYHGMNYKILVIEDEPMITDVVKSYLEHNNFLVRIEHNGIEGLKAFHEHRPDLVVLDLMLPGLTGIEKW